MDKKEQRRFPLSDQEFLIRLKDGDEEAFELIYEMYESQFRHWALQKFNLKEVEVYDIFQDAIAGIYLNVKKGKLKELTCDFQTYLFAVAKNLLLKKVGIENRYELVEDFTQDEIRYQIEQENLESGNEVEGNSKNFIEKMGEPCKSILLAFYISNMSMAGIASEFGYKSADVVKAQKRRCLNYLKKLMGK